MDSIFGVVLGFIVGVPLGFASGVYVHFRRAEHQAHALSHATDDLEEAVKDDGGDTRKRRPHRHR